MRVRELDLLRFVAALAVVLYHYTYHRPVADAHAMLYPSFERASMHGYLGVNLFFMISGFVILWTARMRAPSQFVISRITRLYPEFWVAVILSACAFALFPLEARQRISLPVVLANLTMVPQLLGQPYVDDVYWTLFVELKFYALLWILSVAGQMPRIEGWLYGWLAVTSVCFAAGGTDILRSLTLHPFGPFFISGALFYLARSERFTLRRSIALLICLSLALVQANDGMGNFVRPADITTTARLATAAIVVGSFVAFFMIAIRRTEWSIAERLALLGSLTYPLYLVHNIAKAVLVPFGVGVNPWVQLVLALAFSLGLSHLMVITIERRLRRPFGAFLTRQLSRLPLPTIR